MKKLPIIVLISLVVVAATASFFIFRPKPKEVKPQVEENPLVKQAQEAYFRGDLLNAAKTYQKALENIQDSDKLKDIQKKIEEINTAILFSPVIDECSIEYKVVPGDALAKIAAKFDTTVNLIKRSNNLSSDALGVDKTLKINKCPLSIIVYKSQNLLFLKRGNAAVKTYVISTGKNNSTPVGTFKVINKLENPTWFRDGKAIPAGTPENILGTRWIGWDLKGYGIHGTVEPEKLGQQVTLGCVRMKNEEVEELYDIIPIGTEVAVMD